MFRRINMCVWIEDADAIELNEKSLDIVYQNERVHNFLNSSKNLGISGIKGQGKTFLLKVKRSTAEKIESIDCFPKNLMVDQLDSSIRLDKSINKYMEDYNNWVSLWKIAISITIIKSEVVDNKTEKSVIDNSPEVIKKLFQVTNSNYRPSVYINRLLRLSREELNTAINNTYILLEALYEIHQAVYIFIDKIDQAFSIDVHRIFGDSKMSRGPRNASYWQYCQYSLANAAYDILTNSNNHVKVFYSIRQEALIDSNLLAPNLKRNIESFIVKLEYNKDDLHKMFNMYVSNEDDVNLNNSTLKNTNPVKAFLGIDVIENMYISEVENAFDYIYRHSLKRPSDIMKICNQLSLENKDINPSKLRTIVNESAGEILEMYISELKPFLPFDIEKLFSHINTNIINKKYMRYVCNRYANQQIDNFSCTRDCVNCKTFSPFCVLFNIGLLGYIKNDINNGKEHQSFDRAGNSVFLDNLFQMPESKYYFIHPCLLDIIRKMRDGYGLKHFTDNNVIVGDGYNFNTAYFQRINSVINRAQKQLKKENVFISSIIDGLKNERNVIKNSLIKRGYAATMSEKNDFPMNAEELSATHSHDYCIDKMLECGCIIFIFGKTNGGKYSGDKYKEYCEEIIKLSNGRVKEPSISLVEFYTAIKKNILHYAFIDVNFDDELYKKINYKEEAIKEYNFLSHLKKEGIINDNWISRYTDLTDLEVRVNNLVL